MFPIFDQNKDVEAILINDVVGGVSSKAIIDFIRNSDRGIYQGTI